jgi:hypothetical protein
VVLTPPFLSALFQSLRAWRLLRVLRLLRLAPIVKLALTLRGLRHATVCTGLVVITGAIAERFVARDQEEDVEALARTRPTTSPLASTA